MITTAIKEDGVQIHKVNAATSVFSQEEVKCVDELWDEYQAEGSEQSGYYFIVEKENGQVLGYATCIGSRLAQTPGAAEWDAVCWQLQKKPYANRGGGC